MQGPGNRDFWFKGYGNYYPYYSHGEQLKARKITTDWLRDTDALPVIADEFKRAGLDADERQLYQLPDPAMMIVSVYSRKPEFGIIYKEGHFGKPDKAHRSPRILGGRRGG